MAIARRRGTRNLRLSIRSDGRIRLSIPYGISERQAHDFLASKLEWIRQHHEPRQLLGDGHHVGKSHRLRIIRKDTDKIRSRLHDNEILIHIPMQASEDDEAVQSAAHKAAERALKKEAEHLLPQRLEQLSKTHDIAYRSLSVRKLKSRWGSCDTYNNIVLNIYLIQLDWRLIDYVMLHELTHTRHKHHQPEFWQTLERTLPDFKQRRKDLKTFPTSIIGTDF